MFLICCVILVLANAGIESLSVQAGVNHSGLKVYSQWTDDLVTSDVISLIGQIKLSL